MKKPELLVPAGNLETLKEAVIFGADAVYAGWEKYSLRAGAKNLSDKELREGIAFAHKHGVKVYVAANAYLRDIDIPGANHFLYTMERLGPDALIVSDPAMFLLAREICPAIDLHVSTQANTTNGMTASFWHGLGAKRVVMARELSLQELAFERNMLPEDLEMEVFVHGAMCVSYSGRCLLSSYLAGRDANQGACTHPCRWKYSLMEEKRPGQYLPVFEDENGSYIMNSADLCMIDHIPELCIAGIDSLKIEGRMKSALYVAVVTRAYRRAIDDFFADPEIYKEKIPRYLREVGECTHRKFSTGFYFGKPDETAMIYEGSTYTTEYTFLGIVGRGNGRGYYRIEQKNKFSVGETIEIVEPNGDNIEVIVRDILNENGEHQDSAPHAGQTLYIDVGRKMRMYDVLRRKEED